MKIAVIANCQGTVIKSHLNANLDFVTFVDIPPIHTIANKKNQLERVFSELESVDYIITQPLSSTFFQLSLDSLKKYFAHKLIVVPVIYFQGYHPTLVYLKSIDEKTYNIPNFDYHELPIVYGYSKGYGIDKVLSLSTFIDVEPLELEDIWKISIQNLIEKELLCDIKVSDFIIKNSEQVQFYSFNHPSKIIMNYLSKKILEYIGVTDEYKFIHNDLLSNVIYPSSESIQKIKKMNCSSLYKIKNVIKTRKEMIEDYYQEYDKLNKEVITSTIDFYKNKEITATIIQKYNIYDNNGMMI